MKSLSIIIPNYNGEKLLPAFFPSILEAASRYKGNWEIIIVDDTSKDNSKDILESFRLSHNKIQVIYNTINLGFSGTCNIGIKNSKGEILLLLNNDVKLDIDFFSHFNEHFSDDKTFAVTVKGYSFFDQKKLDGLKTGRWNKGMPRVTENLYEEDLIKLNVVQPYESFSVQGAYFFVDAEKIKILGGFDELFSPYIFEETDLAYRALKRGWKIYYEPKAIAHHAVSSTISQKKKSTTKVIAAKNRIIFVWKNIHSNNMLFSHLIFLLLRIIILNKTYWKALPLVWKVRIEIMNKRKIEKNDSKVSDSDLFKKFSFTK